MINLLCLAAGLVVGTAVTGAVVWWRWPRLVRGAAERVAAVQIRRAAERMSEELLARGVGDVDDFREFRPDADPPWWECLPSEVPDPLVLSAIEVRQAIGRHREQRQVAS